MYNLAYIYGYMDLYITIYCMAIVYNIWMQTKLLFAGDKMQLSLPVGTFTASMLDSADQVILIAAGSGQFVLI